ncbi:hypothetical protein N7448_004260 [Penicillium atrosanguineum]|nr:hypothetical protein N7448_004260 [Penicillium atrosanguineum]
MISKISPAVRPTLLQIYLSWVDAWLLSAKEPQPPKEPLLTLDELSSIFQDENIHKLMNHKTILQATRSFRNHNGKNMISLGGTQPPSNDMTDLFSETYDPQSDCNCDKTKPKGSTHRKLTCGAINGMVSAMETVLHTQDEWHTDLFTAPKLQAAVDELILANTDLQLRLDTCQGPSTADLIPKVRAPDRRPNPGVDGNAIIGNQLYPTAEQIKICADAKYFGVIACGAGLCDEGLARAIADSCNDILIGDYCEAADAKGLKLLQQVGGAAMAFLKLCNMSGRITDWQFSNLAAYMIQCRVLGYFRDHERPYLPDGIYGSHMTGLGVHRHIDVAAFHGVMTASVATGLECCEKDFMRLVDACVYVNDFVDFRGDTMRKQRENVLLRGLRGDVCRYLDTMIGECLDAVVEAVEGSELGALVVMGYCNWAVMGAHHKVYEVLKGVKGIKQYEACNYASVADTSRYVRLVRALEPYGTLSEDGPMVTKRRVEMEKVYSTCRSDPAAHMAWLADATRSLLEPTVLRRIVDVVHYEWSGDVGAVDYCP